MKVYIGIDKETWEYVVASYSNAKVAELLLEQDTYFPTVKDFYESFDARYMIQEMEVE